MIDFAYELRNRIIEKSAITAVVGSRVWAEMHNPPPDFNIDNQGICFYSRGGPSPDYNRNIIPVSYVFKFYGKTPQIANDLQRTFFDATSEMVAQYILHFELESAPQGMVEPELPWYYSLCFYTATFRNG